jgi:hypothetical protein
MQSFGNWICFRPQVKMCKASNLLGPSERTAPHLRTETDPFAETVCPLKYQTELKIPVIKSKI